jgi:cardiolipin synthase A/B
LNWLVAHIEVVFGATLALFAVLLLVQQRRSPQSTAAWLLFVFLLPYLALPMFLMFGIRKPYSASRLKFTEAGHQAPVASALDSVFRNYGVPPALPANRLKFLSTGQAAFSELQDIILEARHSIDAEFYIVGNDAIGVAFVELLEARAKAGLKVRLLIDGFGGLYRPRRALARLRAAGGEVLIAMPFLGLPGHGRLNLRNHRKTLIADERVVFAGGMNVGMDYMFSGVGGEQAQWIDLSFRLEGAAVKVYRDILTSDIVAAQGRGGTRSASAGSLKEALEEGAGPAVAQPVPSGPDVAGDTLHDGLVCAIHRAERRIRIVTPYFLPTDHLAHALHVACRRGVDVHLLVPERSNQMLANFARGSYLRNLRDAGGRIYMLKDPMIHAKAGLIDDFGWAGSANFDVRSMYLNFETVLFLYDSETVAELSDWMDRLFARAVEGLPKVRLHRRIAEGAFRLAAPVL